jgi:glutathione synthase/RimK-type ligase-like ATP-grasp enzyme
MTTIKKKPGEPKRVGILVGWEDTFPKAFIQAVNEKGNGEVVAEFAKVHAPTSNEPKRYDVIVDRISHEIEIYKPFLKNAVLQGTYVINDPFWWLADDKFFDNSLIENLGVAAPRTAILPPVERNPTTRPESHRNLMLTDWEAIFDYVKFPAFLKPYDGGGWKHVYKVNNREEFFHYYHQTGRLVMVLQEFIDFDHYVRCLCIGKDNIMPIKYDPKNRCYVEDHNHLSPELGAKIVRDATVINQALGYDMNSVEFAIRDGVPYAIDFMNPAPDMDYYSILPHYFDWVVGAMSDFVIKVAREERQMAEHYPWARLVRGLTTPIEQGKPAADRAAASAAAEPRTEKFAVVAGETRKGKGKK